MEPDASNSTPRLAPKGFAFPRDQLRVLLVDDNPQDRALVARELREEFSEVELIEVINQEQFNEQLASAVMGLVITDFQLRWTDGLKILESVKARWPHCPVIMFTGTGSEEVAVEAMKGGLDDYLVKGIKHLIRLRAAVRNLVERSHSLRQVDLLSNRLDALLARLKVGVYRRSDDGTLLESNDAFRRICGIDDSRPTNLFGLLGDPGVRQQAERELAETHRFECESQLTSDDSDAPWIAITEIRFVEDDQIVIEGLLEDITVRRLAENSLREAQAGLAHVARLSSMGEMLAGIAHEINQPLSVIANYSAVLPLRLGDSKGVAEATEWAQIINDQAMRATEIIRRIRRLSERRQVAFETVDLGSVVRETLQLIDFGLRAKGTRIELALPSTPVLVFVDRVQIEQVLVNLLQNAADAMADLAPAERVAVLTIAEKDGSVHVSVSDRGKGIPPDTLDKLFEPFYTTKSDGMGMGLGISTTIVKAHGGHLRARNGDRGAVFEFSLPPSREPDDSPPPTAT